jgi:hypothetical protein
MKTRTNEVYDCEPVLAISPSDDQRRVVRLAAIGKAYCVTGEIVGWEKVWALSKGIKLPIITSFRVARAHIMKGEYSDTKYDVSIKVTVEGRLSENDHNTYTTCFYCSATAEVCTYI